MRSLLLAVLTCYLVAAIHSILAFVNKRRAIQQVSEVSIWVGFALHTVALALGWGIDGRYPLFSMRETLSFLAWTMIAAYGLALHRYRVHALGAFMLPIVSILTLMAIVMSGGQGDVETLTGAGGKWLFPFHTTVLIFAYASFFVVFIASVMYLLQERELKLKTFGAVFHRLPSLTTLNDIATGGATIGLTLLTIGIVTGMLWAAAKYGQVWRNDPKEILAGLTWLLYLALIVYRSTARWRGRRAAWMGVAGFALVLCTFLGARMLGGYHVFG